MVNKYTKMAEDRYPHTPTDVHVVVTLSLDSPFHDYLSKSVEISSKCTNEQMIISIHTVSCHY